MKDDEIRSEIMLKDVEIPNCGWWIFPIPISD